MALLEQFKHKEGAESFKNALKIDPKLNLARINLSIALFNVPDLPAAQREAQNAAAVAPEVPQPHYILGLIAKLQSKPDEALAAFQRVLKIDPNDVGANINVGQLYSQQRKYPEAIAAFRLALAAEPYNATALYNLGQALMRAGQREEGQKATARFTELRQRGSATTIGQNYLEQGRYAEAIASTGAEPDLVDRDNSRRYFFRCHRCNASRIAGLSRVVPCRLLRHRSLAASSIQAIGMMRADNEIARRIRRQRYPLRYGRRRKS